MAFVNYAGVQLRASAASSGTSGQDTAVTLPETVNDFWVVFDKTAEFNADNVLTVRLQAQVNSVWFDLSWESIVTTQTITLATDKTTDVTRKTNIVDASTDPTLTILARYGEVPSNSIRVAWIASGTTPTHTFSVESYFTHNNL